MCAADSGHWNILRIKITIKLGFNKQLILQHIQRVVLLGWLHMYMVGFDPLLAVSATF